MKLAKHDLVAALRLRYDHYSSTSIVEATLERAGMRDQLGSIAFLTRAPSPAVGELGGPRTAGTVVDVVPTPDGPVEVRVALKGLVTKEQELARIAKAIDKLGKDLAVADKKLASPAFVEKAPKELVEETRAAREQHLAARARLEESRKLADEL